MDSCAFTSQTTLPLTCAKTPLGLASSLRKMQHSHCEAWWKESSFWLLFWMYLVRISVATPTISIQASLTFLISSRQIPLYLIVGTQDTQCTAGLCSDIMVLEYTQDEYCYMHGSSHCIILVVVMRMLISIDDLRAFSVRLE